MVEAIILLVLTSTPFFNIEKYKLLNGHGCGQAA
jgi:hypothetical protein